MSEIEDLKIVRYKLEALEKMVEKELAEIKGLIKMIDTKKLDSKDFDPYKSVLNKINWAVLIAVVSALIYLVVNTWN